MGFEDNVLCLNVVSHFICGLCVARRSVGLHRRGCALLGHSIKRPGSDLTVVRGHWAPLACHRVADVVRRLRVVVVAPEMFMKL